MTGTQRPTPEPGDRAGAKRRPSRSNRAVAALAGIFSLTSAAGLAALIALAILPRPEPAPPLTGTVDMILIEKSARRLTVFRDGEALRSYRVALGFRPDGGKSAQGDGRTPEGDYRIDRRNPASAYHLSLGIDYPRPADIARAASAGVSPGGDIFIHGQPNALPAGLTLTHDWTAGCIAVANHEIQELWRVVPIGTAVRIVP